MAAAAPALPTHIDSTMRSCFVSCPEKFRLEFVHGYRPAALSIDLHAGGCFATGIEQTYRGLYERGLSLPDALARSHAIFMQEWGDFEVPEFKRTAKSRDRVWEAISNPGDEKSPGYFDTYHPATDHVQPFFDTEGKPTFEYTFAIPLDDGRNEWPKHPSGEPWLYTGRFDMLGTYSGRPVVRDEKTTGSSIGASWADQWNLRAQFIGYVWACQQGGIPLDSVVVRGIGIQKTQIVHIEAIKQYGPFIVQRWLEQLRRDLWRLRRSWDEGYFDFNLGESCSSYGGCHFRPVCSSPTPAAWLSNYTVKHWNPLLKNPISGAAVSGAAA